MLFFPANRVEGASVRGFVGAQSEPVASRTVRRELRGPPRLARVASRHELVEHQGRCCRRCKDDKGRTLRNQKRPTSFSKA